LTIRQITKERTYVDMNSHSTTTLESNVDKFKNYLNLDHLMSYGYYHSLLGWC